MILSVLTSHGLSSPYCQEHFLFSNKILINAIFCNKIIITIISLILFQALIDSSSVEHSLDHESGVRMVALFDHEEVGSDSAQGAGSPAMLDALSRITGSFNSSNSKVLSNVCSTFQNCYPLFCPTTLFAVFYIS